MALLTGPGEAMEGSINMGCIPVIPGKGRGAPPIPNQLAFSMAMYCGVSGGAPKPVKAEPGIGKLCVDEGTVAAGGPKATL